GRRSPLHDACRDLSIDAITAEQRRLGAGPVGGGEAETEAWVHGLDERAFRGPPDPPVVRRWRPSDQVLLGARVRRRGEPERAGAGIDGPDGQRNLDDAWLPVAERMPF